MVQCITTTKGTIKKIISLAIQNIYTRFICQTSTSRCIKFEKNIYKKELKRSSTNLI